MNRPHPTGPLATYNSLTDKHLVGYFSNVRRRRHLQRSGLITRSGRILSEKEYRQNTMRKDRQKFTREYLAHAIFKKVLEMEHNYEMELKRWLETSSQKERVQRVKVGRSRRAVEHYMPVLSPHPPVAPEVNHGSCVVIDQMYSSTLKLAFPRPNTAPGRPSTAPANMQQRPPRLQPLLSHPAAGAALKPASASKLKPSVTEMEGRFPNGGERYRNPSEHSHGVAPYQLPIINEYLVPVPPPPSPRNEKIINRSRIQAWRRRVRPTTAPNIPEPHRDSGRYHKSPLHSNAFITMIYWGKRVHLNHDDINYKDEIKIYQQHCGGENLCVFQGRLLEKETFRFVSKRHYGFPFSLTFFLNGMQLDRLSSCCEFKHRRGSRLGGKNGYFGFVDIEGASPCYKCIISMGLDKKPLPPPKKEKEMMEVNEDPVKEEEFSKSRENFNEEVENVGPMPTTCSAPEDDKKVEECIEEGVGREEKTGPDPAENNQEVSFKDDYDEDFEVDDEKSNEKVNEDGQTDDQMKGRSKSPSDDEKDNLDHEKESETSFQEIRETSDYMKYKIDGCSDNDLEDDKQDGDLLAEETAALETEEESKHDAPEGEQLKRREAFEPKKAGPGAGAEEPRSRKEKEEEEEEEEGEEEEKEEGEEEEEKEQEEEEEAEAALGRGWVVVNATSAPRVLVEVAELTKVREVPGVHWDGEETGAKREGLASKEEGEATERMRITQVITDARSHEEEIWRDRGSERKEAVIQEEETIGKAARESHGDTGEVRHETKNEGRIQSEVGRSKEEEAESEAEREGEYTEMVSPVRWNMAAWIDVLEMEALEGTKEALSKKKETYQEGQEGGEKAAVLRGVTPEEEGDIGVADLEDVGREVGYPRGAEKETAAVGEEIVTEEETEALNETVKATMSQREVVTPLAVAEAKEVFEQLEETTNGGEEIEEKECDTEEGVVGKGMEPVDGVVFHRESAENERKLSLMEAASEVKELSGKEGIPGMEEEVEIEDGEIRYGATREVTCRAKEENKVEKQEMGLPEEVRRSPNNRDGMPDVKLVRKKWTPEEETTTKEPSVTERVETPEEIGVIRAKEREETGVLVKTYGAIFEEEPGSGGQVCEEEAPAARTETEMSLEKEALKNKTQEGKTIVDGQAEADVGDAGGMAVTALKREVLAAAEGKTEENKASSPSDGVVGETWPRQDQLLKKTAAGGRVAVEEEGKGERVPAVEEVIGKAAPEADPATREGVLEMSLMIQALEWERDQKRDIVREDWMWEKSQAEEAGDEEKSRPGSPEPRGEVKHGEGGPQSQRPRGLETMTVENGMTEIRERQESTAQRKDDALGAEVPRP
ncbi:glutamate-rich protein 3 isoform X2 [Phascolarctos cinereus]|uniref:Glutamate-rich protein 3 isoform X5 n=1 Tax=Phascolarctos cinereus TaxID=38626 RepID=A0A6P5IZ25_PHACI|nr:glutamate-rich protein 3 isoform X5 [Phascolarctos cinereus]